jgi:LPXTG-motif cell wall-anchored protein
MPNEVINCLEKFILNYGFWAVLITMTLESMGLPLPSEIIMPLSGFLVSVGQMEMWEAVSAGTLGCTAGSYFAYLLGKKWGNQFLEKMRKFVFLSPGSLERAQKWFVKYGRPIIFWARLLPVLRGVISYPAGSSRVSFWQFILLSTFGSLIWCWALTWAGLLLGEHWRRVHGWISHPIVYALIGILALLILGLFWFLRKKKYG